MEVRACSHFIGACAPCLARASASSLPGMPVRRCPQATDDPAFVQQLFDNSQGFAGEFRVHWVPYCQRGERGLVISAYGDSGGAPSRSQPVPGVGLLLLRAAPHRTLLVCFPYYRTLWSWLSLGQAGKLPTLIRTGRCPVLIHLCTGQSFLGAVTAGGFGVGGCDCKRDRRCDWRRVWRSPGASLVLLALFVVGISIGKGGGVGPVSQGVSYVQWGW